MTTATKTITAHTRTGRVSQVQIDPATTSYVDVYQQPTGKFAIYLRDASRNDQTVFVADSIHATYVATHVKTGKVKWINAIPGDTIVTRVCYLDGSVRQFVKTRK